MSPIESALPHRAVEAGASDGTQARRVHTPAMTAVRAEADYVLERAGAMVVYGEHGTGRTTAVRACLESQSLPWTMVDLAPNPDEHKINASLYRALISDTAVPLREMQDDLVDELEVSPRVVVIRHAERLTSRAAGQVQWLHDRPQAAWTLILIGNADVGEAVRRDPLLAHTITATVAIRPLTDRDLLRVLQDLDPVLLNADPKLLLAIDNQFCKGNLATWTRFLDRVHWLIDTKVAVATASGLDKKLAQLAIGHMTPLPRGRR